MDFGLNRRNFPFTIGAWNNPSNNVIRNVVDSIALAPALSFPTVPNVPPINHRMNNQNQRQPWNSRDANRRYRTRSNLSEMRRTIRRLRNKMRGANLNLVHVGGDLQAVREELEDIKTHLLISTNGLQNVVDEVDRVTNTFNSQILANHTNDFERNELRRDLQTLRRELEDARRNIRYAENDLEEDESEAADSRLRDRAQGNRNCAEASNIPNTESPSTQENNNNTSNNNNNNNNNDPNGDLCTICMGKPVNTVLYKCGHICTCYQCAFKLYYKRNSRRQCPMCRAVIRDFIKIYKS